MPTSELLSVKTLQQAILKFSDEQTCIDAVAAMRWPNGVECPACGHKEHWYLKTQKRWKCKDCNRQFSVKLGTIFEDSPIALTKWLLAMWLLANCKNGVSSNKVLNHLEKYVDGNVHTNGIENFWSVCARRLPKSP